MKKFTVLFTIAVLVGITCVIAFSHHENKNRSDSTMMLEINAIYGPIYNPPTFTDISRTGTDGDGPLYSTADAWSGYTDDGYNSTREVHNTEAFAFPEGAEGALNRILATDRYFEDNLVLEDPGDFLSDAVGFITRENFRIYRAKSYLKKLAVSAYAYVSCSAKGIQYKTAYTLYAEVPSIDFQDPNVRRFHSETPRKGAFHHSVFRWGNVDGVAL